MCNAFAGLDDTQNVSQTLVDRLARSVCALSVFGDSAWNSEVNLKESPRKKFQGRNFDLQYRVG